MRLKRSQYLPPFVNPYTLKLPEKSSCGEELLIRKPLPLVNGIPYVLHKLYANSNIPMPVFTPEEK